MAVTKHAIAVCCPCTLHLCCCRSKVKCASVQDLFPVNLTVNLLDVFLLTCLLLGWLCRGLGSGEGVSFSGVNREKGLNQWCIFKYFFNYQRWLTCSSPSWSLNAIFVARGCQMSVKKSLYRCQLKCSCSHGDCHTSCTNCLRWMIYSLGVRGTLLTLETRRGISFVLLILDAHIIFLRNDTPSWDEYQ